MYFNANVNDLYLIMSFKQWDKKKEITVCHVSSNVNPILSQNSYQFTQETF